MYRGLTPAAPAWLWQVRSGTLAAICGVRRSHAPGGQAAAPGCPLFPAVVNINAAVGAEPSGRPGSPGGRGVGRNGDNAVYLR